MEMMADFSKAPFSMVYAGFLAFYFFFFFIGSDGPVKWDKTGKIILSFFDSVTFDWDMFLWWIRDPIMFEGFWFENLFEIW
jgi:hypothetical protein